MRMKKVWMSLAFVMISSFANAEDATFQGTLAEVGKKADPGVVALLKEPKKKDEAGRSVKLFASGPVAKKLKSMAKDKARVTVTGRATPEGVEVATVVAAVEENSGFSDLLGKAKTLIDGGGSVATVGDMILSQEEIRAGLREALSKGIKAAIASLGQMDGFYKNLDVKIPVPDQFKKVEEGLRLVRRDKLVDDFIISMNRAAEEAVPNVIDIFADSISQMTIEDAKAILNGQKDAATQYFKKTSESKLVEKVMPIVKVATAKVGVTNSYKTALSKASPLVQMFTKQDMDLDHYVTKKAVEGLFVMIAKEEQNIRENPAARTTEILRKIFGAK